MAAGKPGSKPIIFGTTALIRPILSSRIMVWGAYFEVSLRNSMSNGKESGMFWKAVVVVVGVTFAVVVAVGAGLAKRF